MHDVIYEAESALCNINKHRLQLNVLFVNIGNGMPGIGNTVYMYIGETEALNATHERWCQSKEPVALTHLLINNGIIYFVCLDTYLIC